MDRLQGHVSPGGAAGKRVRAHLMLTSDPCGKVELTRREQKREGKRVIAVLKEKNKQEMRLGALLPSLEQ